MTSPTNQPRKDTFHLYSLSPHHLSSNSQQGPPLSGLFGKSFAYSVEAGRVWGRGEKPTPMSTKGIVFFTFVKFPHFNKTRKNALSR